MAELKCNDGTVIKISDETEQELRKAFGPKEEITYSVGDFVWRDMEATPGNHVLQIIMGDYRAGLHDILDLNPHSTTYGWRAVDDRGRITQEELNRMTMYPKGLRKLNPFDIKISVGEK